MISSKEAKIHIIDTINGDMNKEYFINEILPKIEKDLKALEIIKEHRFLFVDKGQLYVGQCYDVELLLKEDDFQDKQEYELLKEVFENE